MASEIAKKIILEELNEQGHAEAVEDVIFWALEAYAIQKIKIGESTFGGLIADAIVKRIEDEEAKQPSEWSVEILENTVCPACGDFGKLDDGSNCPCHY
jgi:hypothetical protein